MRRVIALQPARFVAVAAISLVSGLLEAVFLVTVTKSAFAITDSTQEIELLGGVSVSVGQALLICLAMLLARLAMTVLGAWTSAALIGSVTAMLRHEVSQAWLMSSWAAQHDDRSGELQELLSSFTQRGAALVGSLLSVVTSGFNLLALVVLAFVVDPLAATVVVAAVFMLAQLLRPFRRAVRRRANRSATESMTYASTLSELSRLGLEMHVFHVQAEIGRRIDDQIHRQSSINRSLDFLRGVVPAVYSGIAYLAVVVALLVASAADSTDLKSVGAVMLVMLRSLGYGQSLQGAITSYSSLVPFLEELDRRIARYKEGVEETGRRMIDRIASIRVEDLSFGYADGALVLERVNFTIERGQIVGVVGPSGSGKSTLVQLLLGLRRPTSGRILIDGEDSTSVSRSSWARRVTFVPQAPRLISGSIIDNVRFFRPDVDDRQVIEATRLAHIESDVLSWPEGYGREVGDSGSRLSGGQQQRLTIARALVEQPDVMIFDEPTSALDALNEHRIASVIQDLRGRVTVILIAHREATLQICDRILKVENGTVVEVPTQRSSGQRP